MKKKKWKYSPWFKGTDKPVREGVYECKSNMLAFYYWNGRFWEFGGVRFPEEVDRSNDHSPTQNKIWRGILK